MSNNLTTKGTATAGAFAYGSATRKIKALAFSGLQTSEVDTTFDLPSAALLHDVWIKVTTASTAAGTISVGLDSTTSGDADGFVLTLGTSTTGVFYPKASITAATSGDTVTSCTRGALLAFYSSGTTQDEFGNYGPHDFATDTMLEKSVSYTLNSTSGTAGYLFLEYTEL